MPGSGLWLDGIESTVEIGVSIGVAFFPTDGETDEALLKTADTAMYEAKRSGNVCCFNRQP